MQANRNQRCVSSNPGRNALRWLSLSLLAVLLAACGGGADDDNTPAPAGGSAAPIVSFKLLPARVGLTTGGESRLLALQSPSR